jgi:hypothetical protein
MAEVDPALADYFAVSELYQDWNRRSLSATNPLSPHERVAYLVVDYWIGLHMGDYDGLIYDEKQETVAALRAVSLDIQAKALEHAPNHSTERAQEQAISEIAHSMPTSLEVLMNNAVAAYLRKVQQGSARGTDNP